MSGNWFDLIVLALATWRLSYFMTAEKGPFDAMERLRGALPLGGLTACIKCVSVWAALILMALYWLVPYGQVFVWIMAVSGLALMLRSYTGVAHD
jgi:hypothetical protein